MSLAWENRFFRKYFSRASFEAGFSSDKGAYTVTRRHVAATCSGDKIMCCSHEGTSHPYNTFPRDMSHDVQQVELRKTCWGTKLPQNSAQTSRCTGLKLSRHIMWPLHFGTSLLHVPATRRPSNMSPTCENAWSFFFFASTRPCIMRPLV